MNEEINQLSAPVPTGILYLVGGHEDKGERFVRMAQVIASNPTCIGLGVEEDTAIIVRKGAEMQKL